MASGLDQLLFGGDQTERITAVDFDASECKAHIFGRDEDGCVEESTERFQPFV